MAIFGRDGHPKFTTVVSPTSDIEGFHDRNRGQTGRESWWVITAGVDPGWPNTAMSSKLSVTPSRPAENASSHFAQPGAAASHVFLSAECDPMSLIFISPVIEASVAQREVDPPCLELNHSGCQVRS
jgi:hypothetical protein